MDQNWERQFFGEHLLEACRCWGLETNPMPERFRVGESFMFKAQKEGETLALRITHPDRRSVAQLESELCWIDFLSAKGVWVPPVMLSVHGNRVETVEADGLKWNVCVFKWIHGESIHRKHALWGPGILEEWGRMLGRMQQVSVECNREGRLFGRHCWDDACHQVLGDVFGERFPALAAQANLLLNNIHELERSHDTFGLVHMDLHHGNILCEENRVCCIDFDDSCYHYFVSDLMIPVYSALLMVDENFESVAREFVLPFFRGFKKESNLPAELVEAAPLFLQLRDFELVYVMDLWNMPRDNPWTVLPNRNVREGNPLCKLPWRRLYEEA